MWPSLEWAVWIFNAAGISLIASLVIGLVSTVLIVWTGFVKESYWEKEREASNERIAKLGKETAEANAKVAEAGEGTAKALAKAAGLEKEAANAKLETEKLKGLVAWRTIPLGKVEAMERVLSAKPGSINLRYMDGDPEALYLAIQISQIMGRSRWQVAAGSLKPLNGIVFGINLPASDNKDRQTLEEALLAAGVQFGSQKMASAGVGFGVSEIPGAPFLMIGSKAPAFP